MMSQKCQIRKSRSVLSWLQSADGRRIHIVGPGNIGLCLACKWSYFLLS